MKIPEKPRVCVICGEEFSLQRIDIKGRKVCHKEECIMKFRYHFDDKYWRNKKFGEKRDALPKKI